MGEENPRDMSLLIALAIFTVPLILWYIVYIAISTKVWLGGSDTPNDEHINGSTYIKVNTEETKSYTKLSRRERPPNASFFCRVNGKETFIEGPYEEQFLNRYEKIRWKYKKKLKELRKGVTKL